MRLRTCLVLELVAGASLIAAAVAAGIGAVRVANTQWQGEAMAAGLGATAMGDPASEADEAGPITPITEGFLPEPVADAIVAFSPSAQQYNTMFAGVRDGALLDPLRASPIKRVKFNRGGSSISLRIDFENGAQAAFKPLQTNPQSIPRKEIAAFRISRLLGINAVPPAIGRAFPAAELYRSLDLRSQAFTPRLKQEIIQRGDMIVGELSWWIPVIERAKVGEYEMDSTDGIVTWKRYLTVDRDIPEADYPIVSQISSMVLFDFIINNADRWSGANARVSEDGRILYFMDNTLSFGLEPDGHKKSRIYFERSQRFSRALVTQLRAMTTADINQVLAGDLGPFPYLLTDGEIAAFLSRRDHALTYLDSLIAEYGEDRVLFFP